MEFLIRPSGTPRRVRGYAGCELDPPTLPKFCRLDARAHAEAASRRRARLLRQARDLQRTNRGDQRPGRALARLRSGFRNLINYIAPVPSRDRRLQATTTPCNAEGRLTTPTPPFRSAIKSQADVFEF